MFFNQKAVVAEAPRGFASRAWEWTKVGAACAPFVLGACADDAEEAEPAATSAVTANQACRTEYENASATVGEPTDRLELHFLCGGSQVIRVFEDPFLPAEDDRATGTYYSGDVVEIGCHINGAKGSGQDVRDVSSDPSVGEIDTSSPVWFLVAGTENQYASGTYSLNAPEVVAGTPACD